MKRTDVLIVGSGIAALQLAKKIRDDLNVIILTKSTVKHGNSYKAQGGIAAAIGPEDNPYKHYLDTIEAGSHHNDKDAVLQMTERAPKLIHEFFQSGCSFDTDDKGNLLLGMEGAHSEKRIVHGGGDATGKRMVEFLLSSLGPNVEIIENLFVYELLIESENRRCFGVKGKHEDGQIECFYGAHIVLATGGCGQLYSFTSNAETVTGDGVALAYCAGAELADMEFIQFHPTLLFTDGSAKGLISEAVRGEGARLVTESGDYIMEGVHPLEDLAPRHIVSQTIYEYAKQGIQVFLDIRTIAHFKTRFPTITAICEEQDVDIEKGLIPVVPGSHFLMGGVKTDSYGKTSVAGLYAIGEVAYTGIHGANRLASNSLLEGIVYGERLAEWINAQPSAVAPKGIRQLTVLENQELEVNLPDIETLRKNMMERTGIVRTRLGMMEQKRWLESFHIQDWLNRDLDGLSSKEINQFFMLLTAWLINEAALKRTESRGGHFRLDFPVEDDVNWNKKIIIHKKQLGEEVSIEQAKAAVTT